MKENLQKYIAGKCTVDEFKRTVFALIGLGGEGKLHDFMRKHWKNYDADNSLGNPIRFNQVLDHIHHEINLFEVKPSFVKKLSYSFSKAAAMLVLPLLGALLIVLKISEQEPVVMTKMTIPSGIQSYIELPDGTHVWLNSESEIYFPSTFRGQKKREIKFVGEGYFEIAPDKNKPFIVSFGNDLDLRVTGTSFNLSAYQNDPDVLIALVEGGVKIRKSSGDELRILAEIKPGEVARFDKNLQQISVLQENDMEPYTAWKDGKFVFFNEAFESVLRTMARKYNVKYVIEDQDLLAYRITATFLDETLEEFLKIITTSSPIAYNIKRPQNEGGEHVYEKRIVTLRKK
ncbi:FecR family protein [Thermophagus sp. OGC60D27]|uniref:FecR family protein n=1 Tax=Thermophagus sp. OGC60D27 TaxID=3458415 RepID=UPI004037C791